VILKRYTPSVIKYKQKWVKESWCISHFILFFYKKVDVFESNILILFDSLLIIFCYGRNMWWWPHKFDVVTWWNVKMLVIMWSFTDSMDQCRIYIVGLEFWSLKRYIDSSPQGTPLSIFVIIGLDPSWTVQIFFWGLDPVILRASQC